LAFATFIEITGTLDRLAAGESLDDIVAGYRGRVSREAIIEAIRLISTQFVITLPQLEFEPAMRQFPSCFSSKASRPL
jgi:hypothetical protein